MCTVSRIHTAVYHRIDLLVSRKRLGTRSVCVRHCVTHSRIAHILDTCSYIPNHSCCQFIARYKLSCSEIAYLDSVEFCSCSHHPYLGALLNRALLDTAEHDDSLVRVIERIKDKCCKRVVLRALRCRNLMHNSL